MTVQLRCTDCTERT